jgi:Flp pilus assembly protein TadD
VEWPWPDASDPTLRDSQAHSLNNWGVILAAQGHQHEAIAKYKNALRHKAHYAPAYNNWGLSLYALGDLAGAQQKYLAAIRADPSSPEPHANLGELLMAQRAFTHAANRFRTAILLDPTNVNGHCGLGLALVAAGNGADAKTHLNRCLEATPSGRWSDRARAALTRF